MKNHPLYELSEIFLKRKNYKSVTIKTYRYVYKYYIKYLMDKDVIYAKTSDMMGYRKRLIEQGYSSYKIYIDMCALKSLYKFLSINYKTLNIDKHYAYNIAKPIQNKTIKPHLKKVILTPIEAKHLITKTKENRKYIWDYRDHAIIYLMLTSGLRIFELTYLKRSDYDMKKSTLHIYNQNTLQTSTIHLADGAKDALDAYLDLRKDNNPYLLISHKKVSPKLHLSRMFFIDMFKRMLKTCNLEDKHITPHSLRHTAAVIHLLQKGSIMDTKNLMRHTNIKETYVYVNHLKRIDNDSEQLLDQFILKEANILLDYQKYLDEMS